MLKEVIINVETNEIIEQEMSDEIIAEIQVAEAKAEADRLAAETALAAKAAARQAILDRLGLTADEAALLLGAN